MFKPAAKYRCAQCSHRVVETEKTCDYCGWEIDPARAREAAINFNRRRRRYQWLRLKSKWMEQLRSFLGKNLG